MGIIDNKTRRYLILFLIIFDLIFFMINQVCFIQLKLYEKISIFHDAKITS